MPRPRAVASASLRASAPALLGTALLWTALAAAIAASGARAAAPAADAASAGGPRAASVPPAAAPDADADINTGHVDTSVVHTGAEAGAVEAQVLAPFSADYAAFRGGDAIGRASLRLVRQPDGRWRADLAVQADRGVAGMLGLDLQQSTVFEDHAGSWRPLSQSSVRKGLFLGKRSNGRYDWAAGTAQWSGDLKERHRAPVALRPGDLSGLLINLAIVRDAVPGRELQYRFVEGGRARDHQYRVADARERVTIDDLPYAAMRVERSNGGNDQTVVWVAEGVPTPVRILQREDGEDLFDLRLMAYQGV